MTKKVHQPHDKLLFSSLKNKDVARDAMRAHLPKALLNAANLNDIKLYNTKFVTPEYKVFEADILYEVPLKQGKGIFMLHCEHQSKVDVNMPLRIWQYLFAVLAEYRENHPKESLPVIWPMVVYTGYRKYSASTDLFDMFGENKALAKAFLLSAFKLVDVPRLADNDIKKHKLFGLAEFAFKHKWTKNFERIINEQMAWISKEIASHVYNDYAKMIVRYVVSEYAKGSVDLVIDAAQQYLDESLSEDVMTIAEQLRAEGMQKGKKEGIQEGMQQGKKEGEKVALRRVARNLLKSGADIDMIIAATGLKPSEIRKIKQSMSGS